MVAGAGEGMRDCLANVAGCADDEDIEHFGFGRCVMEIGKFRRRSNDGLIEVQGEAMLGLIECLK